jgi:diguanylate cyclase (GGDEF)-like protein
VSRYGLIRVILAVAILAIAGAVWGVGRIQASADDSGTHAISAGEQMLISMLDQETGLRGFINTDQERFLGPYLRGREQLERAITEARRYAGGVDDQRLIDEQVKIARSWQRLAETELASILRGKHSSVAGAADRKQVMDRFRTANGRFIADRQSDREHDRRVAQTISILVIIVFGALFAALSWVVLERPARRDAKRRKRLAQFADALQIARSEREAFDVLKRHLEHGVPKSRAVVMIRNASQNRLEAATSLDNTPVMAEALDSAAPESCLAVRLAKAHRREPGEDSLLVCEICGRVPEPTSCVPTVVGGEVVGSVVLGAPKPLQWHEFEDLGQSVGAAGPVIANLRNLAIAERRAATDNLTGLANQRSAMDSLSRMVAQGSRSKTPLVAIMFDLDRFKRINDIHGHAKGDEVLATVAAVVQSCVRESDFVGRYGGEEFVALLPDTSREGGVMLAEKLRESLEQIEIPDLDRRISASFGVAVMPGDAVGGEQLLRAADRALYAAKNAGRNRVMVPTSGESRDEPAERARFDDDLVTGG